MERDKFVPSGDFEPPEKIKRIHSVDSFVFKETNRRVIKGIDHELRFIKCTSDDLTLVGELLREVASLTLKQEKPGITPLTIEVDKQGEHRTVPFAIIQEADKIQAVDSSRQIELHLNTSDLGLFVHVLSEFQQLRIAANPYERHLCADYGVPEDVDTIERRISRYEQDRTIGRKGG